MRLSKLTIQNFKAFYGKYEFNFCDKDGEAKNILIYGENGSGKSSLYWTLYHIIYSFNNPRVIKKYKNIFVKKEDKIFLEALFDNDNKYSFDENNEEEPLYIDEDLKNEFEKVVKVKSFLSYNDIFLLNELFESNISLDRFVNILKTLYGKEINDKIESYTNAKEDFKNSFLDKKCEIEQKFLEFRQEYEEGKLLDEFISSKMPYEDIEKWDKEGDFIGYDTIYYYSDEAINEYEIFLENFKVLNEELNFNSEILDSIIYELEDIFEYINEKSKENIEKRFARDYEEIETIDILETLKIKLSFVEGIVESYSSFKSKVKRLNEAIYSKIVKQVDDINKILKNEFDLSLEIKLPITDYFLIDLNDIDKFAPIKYNIKLYEISSNLKYTKILNEAKISSINFAFYLSIILSYAPSEKLKILVLDDLLISLDMSNRDTILDILLKDFQDYQIFFFTHDRAFFEMAKQKFSYKSKGKWKYFEMYVDKKSKVNWLKFTTVPVNILKTFSGNSYIQKIECPFIKPNMSYKKIAEKYFENKDYPAAATYLRKEVEKLYYQKLNLGKLESIIEIARKIDNYHKLEQCFPPLIKVLKSFENCKYIPEAKRAEKCVEFAEKVKVALEEVYSIIEDNAFFNIGLIKDQILNPQSHYDFSKPLYSKELKEAIKLIDELKQIVEDNL